MCQPSIDGVVVHCRRGFPCGPGCKRGWLEKVASQGRKLETNAGETKVEPTTWPTPYRERRQGSAGLDDWIV